MTNPAEIAIGNTLSSREAWLWSGAAALILAAHAAFAYYLHDRPLVTLSDATETSMEVELAPLPISAPPTVQAERLPADTPVETVRPVEDPVEAERVEPDLAPTERTEVAEAVEPQRVEAEPEVVAPTAAEQETILPEPVEPLASLTAPEIAAAVEADVALPTEAPTPVAPAVEEKPAPAKAVELKKKKPEKKAKQPPAEKPEKRRTETTKAAPPPTSAASPKSSASKAPTISPERWNSSVRAAVASKVGRLRGMRGTVTIRFVVSSSGAVTSVQVARSSGDGKLDSAATRAVRSARVPAPPPGLKGSSHPFVIPLTFR